jgi:hypothetical protein
MKFDKNLYLMKNAGRIKQQAAMWGVILLTCTSLAAQKNAATGVPERRLPLIISVFNVATLLPGASGNFSPIHPGLSAGTAFRYNHSTKNQWFQTAKLAVSYHQYVQTSVQLFSEVGYRRDIWRGFGAEMRIGAGYLHSFPGVEVFKFKNGVYEKKPRTGRPQLMVTSAVGISYMVQSGKFPPRFFVDYQFYLQMPFINQYVPLVPNTVVHAGVALPLAM